MRVTYVSRGHQLSEILADVSDDGADPELSVDTEHHLHQPQHHELLPVVSSSLLTHVRSSRRAP